MKPIKTEDCNSVFTAQGCGDLPAVITDKSIVSCWEMTEKDCLEYCYNRGFYWEENGIKLYDKLDRVSCWCCANKNKKELENMRIYLPEYYLKYIDLLKRIKANNKKRSSC